MIGGCLLRGHRWIEGFNSQGKGFATWERYCSRCHKYGGSATPKVIGPKQFGGLPPTRQAK